MPNRGVEQTATNSSLQTLSTRLTRAVSQAIRLSSLRRTSECDDKDDEDGVDDNDAVRHRYIHTILYHTTLYTMLY